MASNDEAMADASPPNAMEVLLNELKELKTKVQILSDENCKLLELKNNWAFECSNYHVLRNQLLAAEGCIRELQDQNLMLREHISSLDGEGASDAPRKSAKRDNAENHLSNVNNVSQNNNNTNSNIGNNIGSAANVNNVSQNNKNTNSSIGSIINSAANATNNNINTTGINNGFTLMQSKHNKKKKILQTINSDLNTIKNNLKAANFKDFALKQSGRSAPIKIELNSPNDVINVREVLKSANVSYHEYKWDDEKSKCIIMRGLVGATMDDLPSIKSDLINAGLPADIAVSLHITGFMRANPNLQHNSLIKIILPPNCDTQIIKNIKFIDHVAVKFEKLKHNAIIQCKNCQRFGHSAGGCMHQHRCVKCGLDHYRDDCSRTFDKSVKLNCCNCGGEHTANNLSLCQFYLQKFVNNKENTSPTKIISTPAPPVIPGLSYARVSGSRMGNENSNINNNAHNSRRMFTSSINSAMQTPTSLENKLDQLIQLVSRHDAMLQKLVKHG